ncbi:MAG: hypothetical protein N2321_01490 [Melioribacteraceae bacterium]|nr:hypothetical protein [Melioribacteraceae bacterium]
MKKYFHAFLGLISLVIFSSCGGGSAIPINYRSKEIVIDGKSDEWGTELKQIPEQKIWLGTTNDDKFFYLCLVTEDRIKAMQMMRNGLITWFIATNNSDAAFGIKYPRPNKMPKREEMQNIGREMFQPENLMKLVDMFLEKQNEFQVLNKDKFSLSLLPLQNKDGIELKLGYTENKFVYEMKIPLAVHEDYSFQIAALPGEDLKIKFETEQNEAMGQRIGMMRQGGGQMSGNRGGGQMQGNFPGAGIMQSFEPLNYSTTFKLALPK